MSRNPVTFSLRFLQPGGQLAPRSQARRWVASSRPTTKVVCWLAGLFGTLAWAFIPSLAPAEEPECNGLAVAHPDIEFEGLYSQASQAINQAPVYRIENFAAPLDSPYRFGYIYRHELGSETADSVWVWQPVTPKPEVWLAGDYGRGDWPWNITWTNPWMTVSCQATRKRSEKDLETADLIVLYTPGAKRELETKLQSEKRGETIHQWLEGRVAALNQVFSKSKLSQRVRLVYVGPTDYDESVRREQTTVDELRQDSTKLVTRFLNDLIRADDNNPGIGKANVEAVRSVHGLREAIGADLVSVVVSSSKVPCGIGRSAVHPSGSAAWKHLAYSVVAASCNSANGLAMAHEIGHNFGLQHDRKTLGTDPDYDPQGYNYGYVDPQQRFVTVMAYVSSCGSPYCKVISAWSSPDVPYGLKSCRNAVCETEWVTVGTERENNRLAISENFDTIASLYPPPGDVMSYPEHFVVDDPIPIGTVKQIRFVVHNPTADPLRLGRIWLTGIRNPEVSLHNPTLDPCEWKTLEPGRSCTIVVEIKPTEPTGWIRQYFHLGSESLTSELDMSVTWSAE